MLEKNIEWFEENLEVVQFIYDNAIFNIVYDLLNCGFTWSVGYAFIESYDGAYFFDDLMGKARSLTEALEMARQRTMATVNACRILHDECTYTQDPRVGSHYTTVWLSGAGEMCYQRIVVTGINPHDQVLAQGKHGERLAYMLGRHKFFESSEVPELIITHYQKATKEDQKCQDTLETQGPT